MIDQEARDSAFEFTGNWRAFAPIAFTNLLLCIVTLGLYIFWARTRERRYLWAETRFIDERLEWTGTGLELFVGYIIAMLLFIVPLGTLQFVLQGLVLRGHPGAAALLFFGIYLLLFYVVGIAIFRALRYRLSRTFWRGIRGGSDDQGFGFAGQYLWRTLIGSFTFGLTIPWAMTSLWNRRWQAMSFGPDRFEANAQYRPIFGKFLLFYLAPILLLVIGGIAAGVVAGTGAFSSGLPGPSEAPNPGLMIGLFAAFAVLYLVFVVVFGLIALVFYAAYFREAVGNLTLGTLQFAFDARTRDWVMLFLGNIALVVCTLGIGQIFIGYRNWSFFIRHLNAFGELNLDDLTQSTTREPGQGEGLLDAFDIGAF